MIEILKILDFKVYVSKNQNNTNPQINSNRPLGKNKNKILLISKAIVKSKKFKVYALLEGFL